MATHASADKAARQSLKRAARNQSVLSRCRNIVKKIRKEIQPPMTAEKKERLVGLMSQAQKVLMKAASKNVLKAKTVSRQISRLSLAIHKAG